MHRLSKWMQGSWDLQTSAPTAASENRTINRYLGGTGAGVGGSLILSMYRPWLRLNYHP